MLECRLLVIVQAYAWMFQCKNITTSKCWILVVMGHIPESLSAKRVLCQNVGCRWSWKPHLNVKCKKVTTIICLLCFVSSKGHTLISQQQPTSSNRDPYAPETFIPDTTEGQQWIFLANFPIDTMLKIVNGSFTRWFGCEWASAGPSEMFLHAKHLF